jgi:hypothetical protein
MNYTYAEDVLDLLINKVSLGTYDKKFLYSLQLNNVGLGKPITSNQHALFKKIVLKYSRQVQKVGQDAQILSELPWTLKVIASSSEFTIPSVKISDDWIIVRTPFKSNFVQDARNARVMNWSHADKVYSSKLGLHNLKIIIDIVTKHYDNFSCCEQTQQIINELLPYDECKYWNPTLIKRQNRLYIASCTEEVHEQFKNIELDTSYSMLAKLVYHGVKIDEELIEELSSQCKDELSINRLLFAVSTHYSIDEKNIFELKYYLEDIECDYLYYSLLTSKSTAKESVKRDLESLQIKTFHVGSWHDKEGNKLFDRTLSMPVLIKYGSLNHLGSGSSFSAKIITITNNEQVDIK